MRKVTIGFIFVELVVIMFLCMQIASIVFADSGTEIVSPAPTVVMAAENTEPEIVEVPTTEESSVEVIVESVKETVPETVEETVFEEIEEEVIVETTVEEGETFSLYNEHLASYGFGEDKQEWLYNVAKDHYPSDPEHYYTYVIAVMQKESTIGKNKYHKNSNGSVDLGIMQVNSCNWKTLKKAGIISSSDDLYDDYTGIRAGLYMLDPCISKWGISQNAYYSYNTGKMKTRGTNKNSNKVWEYYGQWNARILGE